MNMGTFWLPQMILTLDILGVFSCHYIHTFELSPVVLGMVRHGNRSLTMETENIHSCNVTYIWYNVDFAELFQIYAAVQQLELRYEVDVVVILHDIGVDDHLIRTKAVPIIKWGEEPSYTIKFKSIAPIANKNRSNMTEECPIIELENENELYCFEKVIVKEILGHINNDTSFKSQVEVRGADVLSALITEKLKWKLVFIFHETATEMEAARVVDILSKTGIMIVIYNLDTITDLIQILLEAYQRIVPTHTEINFAVLCKFDCIRTLFYRANRFDKDNPSTKSLLRQFSRWLVVIYDHHFNLSATLRDCAKELDNIAVIAFPQVTPDNAEKAFHKTLHNVVLEHAFDLSVDEGGSETNLTAVTDVNITKDIISDLRKEARNWRPVSKCEGFRIDTLMWTHSGRDFNNVGYVSKHGDLVVFADLFPNTKYGYNGRMFQVSTLHYEPFVIKKEENGTVSYGGVCMELLQELSMTLNFTYNLTEPPDQTWGAQQPGNELVFNGMIGQLQREEVDIVAADISIQKEREMVMDFMFPFYYGYTSVLLKKPDPNARKWRTLVDPFQWEILMTIGISLPIVSLMAFLLEKFNPFYNDPENARIATENYGLHTFHDSFWYMYGALLSQGGVNLPESIAGRTFVSCWWLFSIVVVGTYCGNLIAFLTVTKDKPPFETLNEMADLKGTYKWGLQEGTNWETVFKTSNRGEFRRVGNALMEFNETDPSVFAKDIKTQLAKVKNGGYGWIGDTVVMELEMEKDCELMMIKEKFLPLKYAFGFTNNSPHVQIFTKQILSIHESGLLQVWKRRWWPKSKEVCAGSIIAEAKPIKIIDVQSAFYVATGGGFIGFCAFLIELCVGRLQQRRHKHLSQQNESRAKENGTVANKSPTLK
ncbi:glutamate receptor 2-like isoform X1 [Mercenaria mercenaria]|uniref:glutamate receptor 2-like isoform X1 n=1 Tax=Mercenaria mercenaria TaxID=6596 RepID=UPI00234E701D|nr:glutamate receptor 2-like isoform X1 [Mercenaria mercenaria]